LEAKAFCVLKKRGRCLANEEDLDLRKEKARVLIWKEDIYLINFNLRFMDSLKL